MFLFTVDKHGEPQEGQVSLALDRVPADVWISLHEEHRTALQTAAGQIRHHLNTNRSINAS